MQVLIKPMEKIKTADLLLAQVQITMFPLGQMNFQKWKEKQVAGCLFSVQQNIW
jgi:hypothetical protein